MAVAARGGAEQILGVVFTPTAGRPTPQSTSPGSVGSSRSSSRWAGSGRFFDNAAAEAFFSSLEWEVLSRHEFATTAHPQAVVIDWCYGFYNHRRRNSAAAEQSTSSATATCWSRI